MSDGPRHRFLLVLLLLFVGSGCSALIYEIVWFQLLQLVIGSSGVSLGVLLGTFMGGMCLGSLALPHLISPRHHPLRVYAALELATGVIAVIIPFAVPFAGGLYTASLGHGLPGILLRATVCALCLLPPTILMGATLPAIARWSAPSGTAVSWLGFLYGGNIAGGVFGSVLAGFYLLRVHDMATATFVAAGINAIVGAIALGASVVLRHEPASADPSSTLAKASKPAKGSKPTKDPDPPEAWRVYVAIALSGMSALGAEVVWTRMLALMFGATVYTFSIILSVFLTGLGIGSSAASLWLRRKKADASAALGICQFLLAVAIAWTASLVTRTLPYWSGGATSADPWSVFRFDLMRSMAALLPATCLWGASFPLALAAASLRSHSISPSDGSARGSPAQAASLRSRSAAAVPRELDAGRLVARVYAANTLGAIVGALGFSMVVIPLLGTEHAQQALIAICATASVVVMPRPALRSRLPATILAGVVTTLLAWSVPALPPLLVAFGRTVLKGGVPAIVYVGEGVNASVAVSELENGIRQFHVSGKVEASTWPPDMRLQRMLANIPALIHSRPESVLVVGFGAGVTAGTFIPYPDVHRLVICEIEPLIPAHVAPFFARENHGVLGDPRVRLVIDDARHYVLTSHETFDIITSDPIHPWVKGAAALYTKEYFELVKQHLNPGGSVTQWVPLYETNRETVKSEVATFFEVFPNGLVWGNTNDGVGYDLILFGQVEPARIDLDAIDARLRRPEYAPVAESLRQVGDNSAVDLFSTYAGRASDLESWLKDASINRDRNLRLQYLAGLGLNVYEMGPIYSEMLAYRRRPTDLFIASETTKQQLWDAVARVRAGR